MFDNTKRVLIIDNIKSSNIQQAIFILKDRKQSIGEFNILDEANGIIRQYIYNNETALTREVKKKKRLFGRRRRKA